MKWSLAFSVVLTGCLLIAGCGGGGGAGAATLPPLDPTAPLQVSANGRYLVTQAGAPFLIFGDAPQALMVNVSEADADLYFANRASHGFNALWVNLLCRPGTGGRDDGSTYDGIQPFTTPNDLSTPNEAYFAHCDRVLALAAARGLLVILDPCETIDHLSVMRANGVAKCRAYGQFLGRRYASRDNILWMSGNDFQTWSNAADDAVALAVVQGIRETDNRHLHTVELNYTVSLSTDDPNWASNIAMSAAYTYYPTYAEVLKGYNRAPTMPVFMIEATYEFEHDCTPIVLRRQAYWTFLSGATGHVYGNGYIWPFRDGWKSKLDTPGALQTLYQRDLFASLPWYQLVPDQDHSVVTAGYGTFNDSTAYTADSDYVTAARVADGSLVVAYMPTLGSLTVDMTKLSGPATARWYDPTRGTYTAIAGSPFANSGSHVFTPPGNNADGDGDWALVLQAGA